MKKFIYKTLIFTLVALFAFSFVACKKDKAEEDGVKFTKYDFIAEGKSDYKIVYPENIAYDNPVYKAARDLNRYIQEATGISLVTVSDANIEYSESGKYLSLGNTSVLKGSGVETNDDLLGPSGFRIKTVGQNVVMSGAADYGTLYAAYEFLSLAFHFEPYAADEIALDKNVTSLKLPDLDVTEVPSFDYRIAKYGVVTDDLVHLFRSNWEGQIITAVNGLTFHNSFAVLPPETYSADHSAWYSSGAEQLCYTAHGIKAEYDAMVETASGILFNALMANKKSNGVGFMHEDNSAWCGCEKCSAIKTEYGADSATAIMFVNDLAEATNAKLRAAGDEREITYWLFAYLATTNAPVKKTADGAYVSAGDAVDMRKNKLGIVYAPILMDYTKTMEDLSNVAYADIIKQWGALTDDVFFWGYDTVFSNYFAFQNTFGSIQTNLQAAANNNVSTVMLQGQYDTRNGTCFTNFKVYLTAKLEWDVNENYDKLFNDFFDNYFKAASETMKRLFRLHTTHFAWFANEYNVFCQGANDTVVAKYYPKGTVNTFMALIEQAYKDIEDLRSSDPIMYEKLYDRITLESLAYRYMLISLYSSNYLDSELDAMKTSFRSDCGMLGMTNYKEHSTIDGLWASWGM